MATATPASGTQSIDRAAQLLVHVVETAEPPTVGELSERSGLPKSTTSRLVAALERQGLVQRDAGRGVLTPGPVLSAYARRAAPGGDLVALAAASLDRLARRSGETVNLGVATESAAVMLDQRDSRHILGSTNWVGRSLPHHVSVVGKVFLADGAVPFPEEPLERLGPRTITDPALLRVTWSSPARAATRPPWRSSRRVSGRSPRPCATPPAPSSRRSASPAPPPASTTAPSKSSARSCGTRPLRCQSETVTTGPSTRRNEVLHER